MVNRQTWTRVLGLLTRALSLTVQRMLDLWSIWCCLTGQDSSSRHDGIVLLVGLLFTTVLMALTMSKHWSGLRGRGRPHGSCVAVVASVLQLSPVVEMIDKVFSHQMPICFAQPDRLGPQRAPLLRSTVAKGSPGENAMRGVRKLSIVNLPQAGLSLWYHIGKLVPRSANLVAPQHPIMIACAFVASFFSLSFGIADFVLYVWVDDAFVRENKKLVTFHYCVEILMRLPMLVFFHLCGKTKYGYAPIAVLFVVDVLTTTLLLSFARFSQSRRKCCSLSINRHGVTQCVFSVIISVPLFFVNLVFCDPGMGFFYVNQVYYAVKYCELVAMWLFVAMMRKDRRAVTQPLSGAVDSWGVLDLASSWFQAFMYTVIFFASLNAAFVWCFVPARRRKKDERLAQGTETVVRMSTDPVEAALVSQPGAAPEGGRGGTLLANLEGIFELLRLLSTTHVAENRALILEGIVENLWYEALPWGGVFDDGAGGAVHIAVRPRERAIFVTPRGPRGERRGATLQGSIVGGALVVHDGGAARRGRFDSRHIRWDDGERWTRRPDPCGEDSQAVLKLILPQIALALHLDAVAEPLRAPDLEAPAEARCRRPLLSFVVAYAFATAQADVISDLYWALVCLSQEEEEEERAGRPPQGAARDLGYRASRIALLRLVNNELPHLVPDCGSQEDMARFLLLARRMLQGQREVWQQHMDLIMNHSGRVHGGSGSWNYKTEVVRDALRRWRELRRNARHASRPDVDEELLRSPTRSLSRSSLDEEGERRMISPARSDTDMVSPEDRGSAAFLSLPIDPTVQFRGIVIDETEVIPSKQAPLLLTCRTRGIRSRLISSPHQTPGEPDGGNDEIQEKYLLKVGDDLRQDQLMLQMMALMSCVWQERLPPADARLLQIANFRALAVTPQAGYVKFVADSVPLSDALHESRGNLYHWLEHRRLEGLTLDEVLDNFCGSVAACCVVTYILGIGDRHLENLCITRRGQLFHVDFGFILGDDPKPMAPPVRLPQQVAQALLMSGRLQQCFSLAGRAYLELRPLAGLWTSILKLIAATGGSGCPRLARQSMAAISGLRERLRVDQQDEERAASEFLCLMRESSEGMASILIDKVHAAGLFWR